MFAMSAPLPLKKRPMRLVEVKAEGDEEQAEEIVAKKLCLEPNRQVIPALKAEPLPLPEYYPATLSPESKFFSPISPAANYFQRPPHMPMSSFSPSFNAYASYSQMMSSFGQPTYFPHVPAAISHQSSKQSLSHIEPAMYYNPRHFMPTGKLSNCHLQRLHHLTPCSLLSARLQTPSR